MKRAAHLSYDANYFRSNEVPEQFTQIGMKSSSDSVIAKPGGFAWHIDGFFTTAEEIFVINPMELSYRLAGRYSFIRLGRVIHNWSETDIFWRRGLWEPRFSWNKLDSPTQGLVGLHISEATKSSRWHLLVTPFFVPEFGPKISLKEGQFSSNNPWFRPPPANVNVLNKITPTKYTLTTPSIPDVVLNPSLAFRVEQDLSSSVFGLSYAYKPINQLIFTAPFSLDLSDSNDDTIVPLDISVNTRVMYHHALTGDWKFSSGGVDTIFAATLERPMVDYEIKDSDLNQMVQDSATIDLVFTPSKNMIKQFRPFFGYTKLWGGDKPSENEFVEGSFVFERRQQFFDAYKVGFTYDKPFAKTAKFNFRQEVIYDTEQLAGAIISDFKLQLNPKQILGLKIEALGIVQEGEPKQTSAFLRDYRANDRITFEYGYVY